MASTGSVAWNKHFKGKCPIATVMKKESMIFDQDGKNLGRIPANIPVVALNSDVYLEKYPIKLQDDRVVYVTFNNIQKPKSKRVSGIKLKPQDFKTFQNKQKWKSKDLALALVSEIEDRDDLSPDLKNYLIALTKYYAKIDNVSGSDVDAMYSQNMLGLAEIQKDYGEILGALAVVNRNILDKTGYKFTQASEMEFPIRGNEPIIDYYVTSGNTKLSISAKSGNTTNTLKPSDVITMLDKDPAKRNKWINKPIHKYMELIRDKSTVEFPFYALNLIKPNTVSAKALEEVKSKFRQLNFASDKYAHHLFDSVYKFLGLNITKPVKIGQLFYEAEKVVVDYLNKNLQPDEIFKDATSGLVIYVKFQITSQNKHGKFDVMTSDIMKDNKKIKWRSKNYAGRAADKIGFQT